MDIDTAEWEQVEDESVVTRFENKHGLAIEVSEIGEVLRVSLMRQVAADGYEAEIETYTANGRGVDEAAELVETIMTEVDTSNDVNAISVVEYDHEGEPFYDFMVVFGGLLPEGIDPDDVTVGDDDEVGLVDAADADEEQLVEAERIEIHVYSLPAYLVDEVEVNDDASA